MVASEAVPSGAAGASRDGRAPHLSPRLAVEGLTAGYGASVVLEDVSLTLPAGGRLAVLGRNGAGKSTLLATLMGLTRRHAGRILLDGVDVAARPPEARAMAGLGYVPQGREVFATLSVEENLVMGLKGRPSAALEEAYALFPRLKERRRHSGGQLSGGEQQMLATARAIIGAPSVLLLDEPLEGLAPVLCDELMGALAALADGGRTSIVLVEHKLDAAFAFARTVLVLERGRCAFAGPMAELAGGPERIERLLGVAPR